MRTAASLDGARGQALPFNRRWPSELTGILHIPGRARRIGKRFRGRSGRRPACSAGWSASTPGQGAETGGGTPRWTFATRIWSGRRISTCWSGATEHGGRRVGRHGSGRRRRQKMGYVLRGGEEGAERLRLLARVVGPTTEALLSRVGLADGMRCLDVDCGLGAVTRELARRVGPSGQAVGLDLDERVLDLARQDAAQQSVPVVFRAGGVLELTDGPAYDLVYARFLLSHLSQPEEAVRRLAAAARPGGLVVVEDTDFAGHFCH